MLIFSSPFRHCRLSQPRTSLPDKLEISLTLTITRTCSQVTAPVQWETTMTNMVEADFEKGYSNNVKKDENDFDFYK